LVSQPGRGVSVAQCGRRVVRRGLCGLHASAEERAERKEQDRYAAEELAKEQTTTAQARVDHLAEALGVKLTLVTVTPYEGPQRGITSPTGMVRISLDDLDKIAIKNGELT
jgi:hypothetical protein